MTVPPQAELPLLEMRGVGKDYRGVAALKNIDFDLRRGEVHAILGENGAGKSTLMKILSGAVMPNRGEIRLEGQRVQIAGPAVARGYGIAMVYQETSLVPTMTVFVLRTRTPRMTAPTAPAPSPARAHLRSKGPSP